LVVVATPAQAAASYSGGIYNAYQHRDGTTTVRGWVYDRNSRSKAVWMCVWSVSACQRWVRADQRAPDGGGSHWFSVNLTRAQSGSQVSLRRSRSVVAGVRSVSTPGERIVAVARQQVGDRYVWGGSTPSGFDCSGLAMYSYYHAHVASLPHQSNAQRSAPYMRRISGSTALPGDLVFYLSGGVAYHVAIYAGHGMQYSATNPSQGVEYAKIWASNIEFRTDWH
jgi:cell wall-associated NlpC family hydrolase